MTFMLIYESMHSLLLLYDYFGSYIIQNMVAKTGPKLAKTGTSTLFRKINISEMLPESFIEKFLKLAQLEPTA